MAEYNVQINKYNANNLGYDQLYPQPMKHADTHLLNGSDPINVGELGVSNRNLLDNAYFANPDLIIDQRGGYVVPPDTPYYSDTDLTTQAGTVSAYTKAAKVNSTYGTIIVSGTTYYVAWSAAVRGYTGTVHTVDRFVLETDGGAVLVRDGYIRIVKTGTWINLEQRVDNFSALKGKRLTVSALVDGNINIVISIGGNRYPFYYQHRNGKGVVSGTFVLPDDATAFSAIFQAADNSGVNIYAAKLELGTVQTLAHQDENGNWVLNETPDYGEQLARCQRQAEKSCNMGTSVGSPETASPIIKVAYSKWGFCEPMVFFKVPKRAIPAVKIFSAKTGAEGMAYDETAMQDVAVTPSYVGQNSFTVQHASENLVTGHAYQFYYFATAEL